MGTPRASRVIFSGKPSSSARQIMRGRLALDGRVQRQDDLTHLGRVRALHQLDDGKIVRPAPVQRRQRAAQHMIARTHDARPLQRPEVAHLLHHANQRGIARRVLADGARLPRVDIAAFLADRDLLGSQAHGARERQQQLLALLDEMQRRAAGRARPEPRHAAQQRDQLLDLGAGGFFLRCSHAH